MKGYKNKQGKFIPTGKTAMPKIEHKQGMYGNYVVPAESIFQDESGTARRYGASNLLGNSEQIGNPLYLTNPKAYKKWSKDDENWLTDDQIKKERERKDQNNKKAFG